MEATENKHFDYWQDHSLRFLEMAYNTDKRERIKNPDGYGKRAGVCGDTIEVFLVIKDDFIQNFYFDTDGCIQTNACCNTVACLTEGRDINRAWKITPEKVIKYLQTLPPDHYHCAELAVGAFFLALSDYEKKKNKKN